MSIRRRTSGDAIGKTYLDESRMGTVNCVLDKAGEGASRLHRAGWLRWRFVIWVRLVRCLVFGFIPIVIDAVV